MKDTSKLRTRQVLSCAACVITEVLLGSFLKPLIFLGLRRLKHLGGVFSVRSSLSQNRCMACQIVAIIIESWGYQGPVRD